MDSFPRFFHGPYTIVPYQHYEEKLFWNVLIQKKNLIKTDETVLSDSLYVNIIADTVIIAVKKAIQWFEYYKLDQEKISKLLPIIAKKKLEIKVEEIQDMDKLIKKDKKKMGKMMDTLVKKDKPRDKKMHEMEGMKHKKCGKK
jgi:hypothetical protein